MKTRAVLPYVANTRMIDPEIKDAVLDGTWTYRSAKIVEVLTGDDPWPEPLEYIKHPAKQRRAIEYLILVDAPVIGLAPDIPWVFNRPYGKALTGGRIKNGMWSLTHRPTGLQAGEAGTGVAPFYPNNREHLQVAEQLMRALHLDHPDIHRADVFVKYRHQYPTPGQQMVRTELDRFVQAVQGAVRSWSANLVDALFYNHPVEMLVRKIREGVYTNDLSFYAGKRLPVVPEDPAAAQAVNG